MGITVFIASNFSGGPEREEISYSQFIREVNNGNVVSVVFEGESGLISGTRRGGDVFETVAPAQIRDGNLLDDLLAQNVYIKGELPEKTSLLKQAFLSLLPLLLIGALFLFLMRPVPSLELAAAPGP